MSLTNCPECGHEISNAAIACPNCGRPLNSAPVVQRRVVVADNNKYRNTVPAWAMGMIAVAGLLVLFLLFAFWGREGQDESDKRLRVNVNSEMPQGVKRPDVGGTASNSTAESALPRSERLVPGSQIETQESQKTSKLIVNAKIINRDNRPQPARAVRFYLLDKDIERILSDAGIEPIAGQSMLNSFGIALLQPEIADSFTRNAMAAIKPHIRYAVTTDTSGKAQLGIVEPAGYYLFGVTRTDRGYAVWNSSVSIAPGEVELDLEPQRIVEAVGSNDPNS